MVKFKPKILFTYRLMTFSKVFFLIFLSLLIYTVSGTQSKTRVINLKFETFLKYPTFEKKSLDLTTLPDNFVVLKSKDSYRRKSKFIIIYNEEKDEWESYYYLKGYEEAGVLQGIFRDKDDLWLKTEKVTFKYNLKTKKLTQFDFVFYSIEFEKNCVWLGTDKMLLRYDKSKDEIKVISEEIRGEYGWRNLPNYIGSISVDNKFVYFTTVVYMPQDYAPVTALKRLNKETGVIETLYYDDKMSGNDIQSCLVFENYIWCVGIYNYPIIQFDKSSGKIIKKFTREENPYFEIIKNEPKGFLINLFKQDTNLIFRRLLIPAYYEKQLSSYRTYGYNYSALLEHAKDIICKNNYCWAPAFDYYISWVHKINVQNGNYVIYIVDNIYTYLNLGGFQALDANYVVFLGRHGITLHNRENKSWKIYTNKDGFAPPIDSSDELVRTSKNFIIVDGISGTAAPDAGICEFNKKIKKWKCYKNYWTVLGKKSHQIKLYVDEWGHLHPNPLEAKKEPPHPDFVYNYLWYMQMDDNEDIWITDRTGSFVHFDRKKNFWEKIGEFGAKSFIFDKNKIWIGSNEGIMLYDKKKRILKSFPYKGKKKVTQGCSWIAKNGNWIWCSPWIESDFNPYGYGLKRFNIKTHQWIAYPKEDGKVFYSMFYKPVVDKDGVYFSGYYGILWYDKKRNKFKHYGSKDCPCESWNPPVIGENYIYCMNCPGSKAICKKLSKNKAFRHFRRYHKKTGKMEIISIPANVPFFVRDSHFWIKEGEYLKKARIN